MKKKLAGEYDREAFSPDKSKVLVSKLKDKLRREVQEFLLSCGLVEPKFDPFSISSIGKAHIKWEYCSRALVGADGSLSIEPDGFLIRIDEQLRTRHFRLRSTASHELMHTFFYDTERTPPIRLGQEPNARWHLLLEEEICNSLGREFLVPTFSLHRILTRRSELKFPSPKGLEVLKSIYEVSSDILAYRLVVDLGVWNAIFVKFVKDEDSYVSKTKMKSKNVQELGKLKIPIRVSSQKESASWHDSMRESLQLAETHGASLTTFVFRDKSFLINSKIDSLHPLSIYSLISISDKSVLTEPGQQNLQSFN